MALGGFPCPLSVLCGFLFLSGYSLVFHCHKLPTTANSFKSSDAYWTLIVNFRMICLLRAFCPSGRLSIRTFCPDDMSQDEMSSGWNVCWPTLLVKPRFVGFFCKIFQGCYWIFLELRTMGVCGASEKWENAFFEDYTGPQMTNRLLIQNSMFNSKPCFCPFLWLEKRIEGNEKFSLNSQKSY